jgi:endonuclease V-like protein UPF0215 family
MGVDDGPYVRGSEFTPIVMTVCRLDGYLEGVLASQVATDGDDSAAVIADALARSRFKTQVRCILSDGGCLAGFNVLDMDLLNELTGLPVVTASDEAPDQDGFARALMASGLDRKPRQKAIGAHPPIAVELPDGACVVRCCGIPDDEAVSMMKRSVIRGRMPEPVRIAHMIASVIGRGAERDGIR